MVESNNAGVVPLIEEILKSSVGGDGTSFMLYPRKVTNAVKKWLPPLATKGLLVFGEKVPSKHSSSAVMYRFAQSIDEPSVRQCGRRLCIPRALPSLRAPMRWTHLSLALALHHSC